VRSAAQISLMEYFKEAVESAVEKLRLQVSEHTEFYLVNLLTTFARTEKMRKAPTVGEERSYAELLLESPGYDLVQQTKILKFIGDVTLFRSGYFSDSFKRGLLDLDYYTSLGTISYKRLCQMLGGTSRSTGLEELYTELAERFMDLVDVVAEVSEAGRTSGSIDLLRVYERWIRTRSKRDAALLKREGIEPLTDISPKFIH